MKIFKMRSLAILAVACLALASTLNLFAAPTSGELLTQAYADLEKADHDYKGHRIDAMKQIEAAGKLLNIDVHGDGKGHEKQGVSDEHLKEAQNLLEEAKSGLKGKTLGHVKKAISELTTALKIK